MLENSNELLKSYDGAIGVKTGNTSEAGYCLVAAAQRRDQALIAVILGSQEKHVWQDAKKLLDHGFKNLQMRVRRQSFNLPLISSGIPCQSLIQRDIETTMRGGLNI